MVVVVELDDDVVVVVGSIKELGTQLLICVADINGIPSGSVVPTKVVDVELIKYISLLVSITNISHSHSYIVTADIDPIFKSNSITPVA